MVVALGFHGSLGNVFRGKEKMGSLCMAYHHGMPMDHICDSNRNIWIYPRFIVIYIGIYEECYVMEN